MLNSNDWLDEEVVDSKIEEDERDAYSNSRVGVTGLEFFKNHNT